MSVDDRGRVIRGLEALVEAARQTDSAKLNNGVKA
jgi:hypothetical protein